MSASLLKKSLKLLEQNSVGGNKQRKAKLKKHCDKRKLILKEKKEQEKLSQSNVKKNLERLKDFNEIIASEQVTKKIVKRVKKEEVYLASKRKNKSNQKTAFTEEDFAKFEREYQGD